MARVGRLSVEEWPDEILASVDPETSEGVERDLVGIMARAPRSYRAFRSLGGTIARESGLSLRLLELVRLRIAFFNQCRSCMAIRYESAVDQGVTEGLVCSLERPEEAEHLSAEERAALHYAELMATDHLRIDDSEFDTLREHFTEDQIVSLGMYVAMSVGFGRLAATWSMTDNLADRFRAAGTVTPWGSDGVLVHK